MPVRWPLAARLPPPDAVPPRGLASFRLALPAPFAPRAWDVDRALDACRVWDACRACEPVVARDTLWPAAGALPAPAPLVPGTAPKSAIMPGICTMPCVPGLPARPAVPTILVVPSLAAAPWPAPCQAAWLLTDAIAVPGTAAAPGPAWTWARIPAVSASAEPPAWEPSDGPLPEVTALSSWPLLTKPVTPCAASEPVNVCALTDRFGAESPPIVRSARAE